MLKPFLRGLAVALLAINIIGCKEAERPRPRGTSVAVVKSPVQIVPDVPDTRSRLHYFNVVADALRRAGIPFSVLSDEDVMAGKLADHAVAIFPYSPLMDAKEARVVAKYIRGGGKVIASYRLPPGLAGALGVLVRGSEFGTEAHEYDRCRLVAPGIEGAPEWFLQHTWHLCLAEPHGHDARVLYEWCDPDGESNGRPAVILSKTGAYIAHVLTKTDRETKAGLLAALIGHFIPEIWPRAAARALRDVGRVGRAKTLANLRIAVATAQEEGRAKDADERLDRADEVVARARGAIEHGDFPWAIELASEAHRLAADAYVRTLPTRDCELRGMWLHRPAGIAGWSWDRTIRHLDRMGFNAVFVNMAWGGEVAYRSEWLPLTERAEGRDQLALCLAACRKYGVECHVWKVCLNLGRCGPGILEKFERQGRLQRDRFGKTVQWLCPSDLRNWELEWTIMLEIARRYDVDGIHLDYIRYPNADCCYCSRCRKAFGAEVGARFRWWPSQLRDGPLYPTFRIWRQDRITRIVKTTAELVRAARPGIAVSAAVFPNWDSEQWVVGQDWAKWVRKGYLDFVCPMDYFTDEEHLRKRISRQVQIVGGRAPVYIGLPSWLLQDVTDLGEQMRLTRELGADGYVLFHYDDRTLIEGWLPLLRNGPTAINAVTPHTAPDAKLEITKGARVDGEKLLARDGEAFTVEACVTPADDIRQMRLELHSPAGHLAERGIRLTPGRESTAEFSPPPGIYRPAIVGYVGPKPFVRRGRIIEVIAIDEPDQ